MPMIAKDTLSVFARIAQMSGQVSCELVPKYVCCRRDGRAHGICSLHTKLLPLFNTFFGHEAFHTARIIFTLHEAKLA